MPLSPGSTPPRDDPERALAHSTPAKRRAEADELTDDGQMSAGDREYSEEEEIEQPQPESLRSVRTRVSLQARGTNSEDASQMFRSPAPSHSTTRQPPSYPDHQSRAHEWGNRAIVIPRTRPCGRHQNIRGGSA
jgi:hypothetical protein